MSHEPKGAKLTGRCWSLAAVALLPLLSEGLIGPDQGVEEGSAKVQIFMICLSGLVGIATWLFFLWGVKDKQFDNVEEVASRVTELGSHSSLTDVSATSDK